MDELVSLLHSWLVDGVGDQADILLRLRNNHSQLFHLLLMDSERSSSSLRSLLWKFCLNVGKLGAEEYIGLVARGKSSDYRKIRGDAHRTRLPDKPGLHKASEEALSRILNAYVHSKDVDVVGEYFQGMNGVAALFLSTMPELDAFFSFRKLLVHVVPQYFRLMKGNDFTVGMKQGMMLIDSLICARDEELWEHLHVPLPKGDHARSCSSLYAKFASNFMADFGGVMSETLLLWDFYMLFGFHMNVFCVATIFLENKAMLMETSNALSIIGSVSTKLTIRANLLISKATLCVSTLPEADFELFDAIRTHTVTSVSNFDALARKYTPIAEKYYT